MKDIILTTINAKWIHPSLALRLLKANLGSLEERCGIIEFALRQPLAEKTEPLLAARPRVLGVSVSIWNHAATIELLRELEKSWAGGQNGETYFKPIVVLGGPEVSHLPPQAEIFSFADYVIRGEGEEAFWLLCEELLTEEAPTQSQGKRETRFINAQNVDISGIKSAYHLYTDEDLSKKLIYVEASRGCLFNCEFCLSAVKESAGNAAPEASPRVREFPLDLFLAQMDELVRRGAKTFKFLDRSFNTNVKRALLIMEFFLEKIEERKEAERENMVVHFEMVPSLFPKELRDALARFPPGTLRLEIGIQTFNSETAALISRPSNPQRELETLRFLMEETTAIIHVDLIAGLPGEDLASFGRGFDRLINCLACRNDIRAFGHPRIEIQLGIIKLLPGSPISRHNDAFGMRYNPQPPYEIEETGVMSAGDLNRIKNFARFWELVVNRGLISQLDSPSFCTFEKFMALSDTLFAHFGRNWGIGKNELLEAVKNLR